MLPPCRVCSRKSSGIHFGEPTCEACKKFYYQNVRQKDRLKCKNYRKLCEWPSNDHKIKMSIKCRKCRMARCIAIGMSHANSTKNKPKPITPTEAHHDKLTRSQVKRKTDEGIGQDQLKHQNGDDDNDDKVVEKKKDEKNEEKLKKAVCQSPSSKNLARKRQIKEVAPEPINEEKDQNKKLSICSLGQSSIKCSKQMTTPPKIIVETISSNMTAPKLPQLPLTNSSSISNTVSIPRRIGTRNQATFVVNPLLLINGINKNNCFVNVNMNLFNSIPSIRQFFLHTPVDQLNCPILKEMSKLINGKSNSVSRLKKLMPEEYHTEQHCALNAYNIFIEKLSEISKKDIKFTETTDVICSECDFETNSSTEERKTSVQKSTILTREDKELYGFPESLESALNPTSIPTECANCKNIAARTVTYTLLPETKFLIVKVYMTQVPGEVKAKDLKRTTDIKMLGSKWNFAGGIEFNSIPKYGEGGHYVYWKKASNNIWMEISDDRKTVEKNPEFHKRDIQLMLFEKQ